MPLWGVRDGRAGNGASRAGKTTSSTNGAERRTGTRIACVGVSALIAGQLFMPAASLAAESADQDVAAGDAAAAAPAAGHR